MDRLLLMQYFVRAVEMGSFSAVAREFGVPPPNVSRNIAALEKHLGARLLHRSTRNLALTSEGERYYKDVRQVLAAVAEAESTARGSDTPSGRLRVTCPVALGQKHLTPALKPLFERYPQLQLDLQLSDEFIDLVEDAVDLGIRIGELKDSALRARRIGSSSRPCVASPEYLARHRVPQSPADLQNHNCICYSLLNSGQHWSFREAEVAVSGALRTNSLDSVYQAALDGLGIACLPLWLCEEALQDGRLQPVLLAHIAPPLPVHIVYSATRLLPRRATVFMDYVTEIFERVQALNDAALLRLTNR